MDQICMYCDAYLGTINGPPGDSEDISHGICPECLHKFVAGIGEPLMDFLDSLPGAVFVVDTEGRFIGANTEGLQSVGKDAGAVQGRLGGEVFECKYAELPGGCGQTIHCKTCTMRQTVMRTFETGESCVRRPAYLDLGDISGAKSIRYLISTEKVGDVVLLRIDDA